MLNWEFQCRLIDNFLTTFYYVKKRNGILRKNCEGEGFEKSYVSLHGDRGSKIAKIILT